MQREYRYRNALDDLFVVLLADITRFSLLGCLFNFILDANRSEVVV